MTDRSDKVPRWKDIPWGLGAWSIEAGMKVTQDKIDCINGIKEIQESGDYPNFRASIYFNSLTGRVGEDQNADVLDTFEDYMKSSAFYQEQ